MTKKIITTFVVFFVLLFISNKLSIPVQAQEDISSSAQSWRCLQAVQTGTETKVPPPETDVDLLGRGFPSLYDIYIVLCAPPPSGRKLADWSTYKCTTGNPEFDRLIFGSNLTDTILPTKIEVPKGSSPPQVVQASGDTITQTVHMINPQPHLNYAYFGVTVHEPKVVPGQESTIQYGTIKFNQDPAGCFSIRWDPYGRVFDSKSLEPIDHVGVTLLDKNKQVAKMPGLRNPEVTEQDGIFNFFVDIKGDQPETFYLVPTPPSLPPTNLPYHTFTADPDLHPNYNKAYYDIYRPDDPIVEAPGFPEHRDIPLDPGSNPPFRAPAVLMSKASVKLGRWIRYEGVISHPLSIVTLVGKNSKKEVARVIAEKDGVWQILVPIDNIPQNEALQINITKVDLTTIPNLSGSNVFSKILRSLFSLLSKTVSAQPINSNDPTQEFQPIPSYVEGYAYSQNGEILPNATVKVILDMSKSVYFQTTADENGFFTVQPEDLPIFDYHLEFIPKSGGARVNTNLADFALNNEDYLNENNINLMAATKNNESLLPPLLPTEETNEITTPNPDQSQGRSLFAGNNVNLILTVIALIVLLGVAGGVMIYIKKKKTESDYLL